MGLFSSAPTAIEKAVAKATDENLTSEDWSLIIDVCDEVNTAQVKNAPLAVEAVRNRLEIPNGNIQLYSLTTLNALAQNCGAPAQRAIASAATTSTLNRLGTAHSTHRTVLARLLDILAQLTDQFAADPTLAQIRVVYERVAKAHPALARNATQPRIVAKAPTPARPQPQRTKPAATTAPAPTEEDMDEDLRRALELSLQDMGRPQAEVEAAAAVNPPVKRAKVRALYDFTASEEGELSFQAGDIIEVIEGVYKEWWKGQVNGDVGIFPVNYVEAIDDTAASGPPTRPLSQQGTGASSMPAAGSGPVSATPASTGEIDENYVFAQIPAVDKLLTILASASQEDDGGSAIIENADVQNLYNQIAAMRPLLIQLIEEYSVKKQDLVDLNQKLLQARRSYERLMEDAAAGRYHHPAQVATRSGSSAVSHPGPEPAQYAGQPYAGQQYAGQQYAGQSVPAGNYSIPYSPGHPATPTSASHAPASHAPAGYWPAGAQHAAQPVYPTHTRTYSQGTDPYQNGHTEVAEMSQPGHLPPSHARQPIPQPGYAPPAPEGHNYPHHTFPTEAATAPRMSMSSQTSASRLPYPDNHQAPPSTAPASPYTNGVASASSILPSAPRQY